ncbi:DUF6868 family protein [Coralliovum pocilloporae]|uniref:DUF6868 family protein n=1 Tax=Coralliovum pocilloporae TaxID=3066369 RepID=UPI003306B441
MSAELLQTMLGWSLVLNLSLLVLSSLTLVFCGDWAARLHSRQFGLDRDTLKRSYFAYLAHYKIGILLLNLSPYLALRIAL